MEQKQFQNPIQDTIFRPKFEFLTLCSTFEFCVAESANELDLCGTVLLSDSRKRTPGFQLWGLRSYLS